MRGRGCARGRIIRRCRRERGALAKQDSPERPEGTEVSRETWPCLSGFQGARRDTDRASEMFGPSRLVPDADPQTPHARAWARDRVLGARDHVTGPPRPLPRYWLSSRQRLRGGCLACLVLEPPCWHLRRPRVSRWSLLLALRRPERPTAPAGRSTTVEMVAAQSRRARCFRAAAPSARIVSRETAGRSGCAAARLSEIALRCARRARQRK